MVVVLCWCFNRYKSTNQSRVGDINNHLNIIASHLSSPHMASKKEATIVATPFDSLTMYVYWSLCFVWFFCFFFFFCFLFNCYNLLIFL